MGCGGSRPSRPLYARRRITLGELNWGGLSPLNHPQSEECLRWLPMRGSLPLHTKARFFSAEGEYFSRAAFSDEGVLPGSAGMSGIFSGGALAHSPLNGGALSCPYYEVLQGGQPGWSLGFAEWREGALPPPGAVVTGRLCDGTPLFTGIGRSGFGGPVAAGRALPGMCAAVRPHGTTSLTTEMYPLCHVLTARRVVHLEAPILQPLPADPGARAQWGWQIEARNRSQGNVSQGNVIAAGILWSVPAGRANTGSGGGGESGGNGGWVDGGGQPIAPAVFSADASGQLGSGDTYGAGGDTGGSGGWGDAQNGGYGGGGDGGGGGGGGGGDGGGGGGGGDGGGGGGGGGDGGGGGGGGGGDGGGGGG
jgi:hypothetical protein